MVVIDSSILKDLYYANLIYEIHKTAEKLRIYRKKYGLSFDEFEETVKSDETEDFNKWDDYMEWKAYEKLMVRYQKEKKDLEIGNYKVS
ncbi:MAG: hypothetical protein ACE5HS_11825 [bacterium]